MRKALLAALAITPAFGTPAIADTTFGIGAGSLYNGLGLNFGRTTGTTLTYGALGCVGFSSSSSESRGGDGSVFERSSSYDSNCGVGVGRVSTSFLPGNRQGLGLSLGLTYDTDEGADGGGVEWRLTPSYHYFFDGIDRRGLTLGIGPQLVLRDGGSTEVAPMLSLGFQF